MQDKQVSLKEARHLIPVLIVCKRGETSALLRTALLGIGFDRINSTSTLINGLNEIKGNPFALVFFDAEAPEGSEISALQFVDYALKLRKEVCLVPVSMKANGELIFQLMKVGARQFIMPPFTPSALEQMFVQLQEGVRLSDEVLNATDRNEKFSELIQEQLDRLAEFQKRLSNLPAGKEAIKKQFANFQQLVRMARFFAEYGEEALRDRIHDYFVDYVKRYDVMMENSRLKSTRRMLRAKRSGPGEE